MKKSISYILILSIVISLLAPMGVLAVGEELKTGEDLFNYVRERFSSLNNEEDRAKAVFVLAAINKNKDETYEKLPIEIKNYLTSKGFNKDNINGLINVLLDNKEKIKGFLNETDYSKVKVDFEDLMGKLFDALPDEMEESINGYAPSREQKIDILVRLADEFKHHKFFTAEYSKKDGKFTGRTGCKGLSPEEIKTFNMIVSGDESLPLTGEHNSMAIRLALDVLIYGADNSEDARELLIKAGLMEKIMVDEPTDPDPTPPSTGGGGGSTTPTTPTTPKEIATTKTVGGVSTVIFNEKEAIAAVEDLRKEVGTDKEAVLVIKLDDVKGTDLNFEVPEKLYETLIKEKVDLNIVTKDIELVIPFDALSDITIPSGATIRLKTEDIAKDVVKENVEEGQDVKKVIELYLEIVKGDQVTKVSKFKSPITVKINVQGLGNKDKLAVYYLNEEENKLEFVTGKIVDNQAILNLNHFSKYVIVESNKTFEDIANHWSKLYVESMIAKNVIDGYTDGTFKPDNNITRAEFAKMVLNGLEAELVKYNGQFDDVKASDWHADHVATMKELGLVEGYGDGTFRPNDKITRSEIATILAKVIDENISKEEVSNVLAQFTDKDNIPNWAVDSIAKVVKAKVMVGSNNKFQANSNATRAESATTIYRIYNK